MMSAAESRNKKHTIAIALESKDWRSEGRSLVTRLRQGIRKTLAHQARSGSLTLVLADDQRLQDLNATFRQKDKPTNVLSFPAAESGEYLGDIAIAHGVAKREANAAGKSLSVHALHLAIHGTLHLLGHDHMAAKEARLMEEIERKILAEFGVSDPYVVHIKRAGNKALKNHV